VRLYDRPSTLEHYQVREKNYLSETLNFVNNIIERYKIMTHSVSGR